MLKVDLETKFTSSNFTQIINRYWFRSLEEQLITFDLKKLEWIAIEQACFLISWINKLTSENKKVIIYLPDAADLDLNDDKDLYKSIRRQTALNHLTVDWRLLLNTKKRAELIYGSIKPSKESATSNPFYQLPRKKYSTSSFDNDFDQLYNTELYEFSQYVKTELQTHTFLSYFDNHFLHYSILKEFYSNVCQHAYLENTEQSCSVSLKINRKIDEKKVKNLRLKLEDRFSERSPEELAFFKRTGGFRNEDYIEICFQDFGMGITESLRPKYIEDDLTQLSHLLSISHSELINEDSRILEYSFLLFTSKYEIGKDFTIHDYIPRGLYIVKDTIRRYKGMLIAKSWKGTVIFDFSKTDDLQQAVTFRSNDGDNGGLIQFPGTSLTIILPTKQANARKIDKIQSATNSTEFEFRNINLLQLITESEAQLPPLANIPEKKLRFFELFFTGICSTLSYKKNEPRKLFLLDFAGVEISTYGIFHKLIYFVTYCPLINDKVNICIYNVIEKGVRSSLVSNQSFGLKSKGFFSKPIPCIYPDLSVEWIGINNPPTEEILINLWKGDSRMNSLETDNHHIEGNCILIDMSPGKSSSFVILIPNYYDILKEMISFQEQFIREEINKTKISFIALKKDVHDYNVIKLSKKDERGLNRSFQTANGKFQKEFLSLVEKLYIKEYRRFLATHLLLKYVFRNSGEVGLFKLDKIITVTLSSQLLGKEFLDIFNSFGKRSEGAVLIRLSNYYEFRNEEPFEEIRKGDSVLLVNDVVSTGNLSSNIFYSLKDKEASLRGILAVIDTRTIEDKKIELNAPLTSLAEIEIKKFEIDPFASEGTTPVRINTILNSPTTMSRTKGRDNNILMNPLEFMKYFENDDLFLVGNFRHNTVYHTYFFLTSKMMDEAQDVWMKLIKELLIRFKKKILSEEMQRKQSEVQSIIGLKSKLTTWGFSDNELKVLDEKMEDVIKRKMNEIERDETTLSIDFVFYPFFSSISQIENNINPIAFELNKDEPISVFPIPRIMTPKGWRFSFPPKFLNLLTDDGNKNVLILDDGSCTGETIIQMIDTISFLNIKQIYVLSIFARLEDYQIEFLTRIKEIETKSKIISINIFLGTQFHIPVYSKNNNPASIALRELETVEDFFRNKKITLDFLTDFFEFRKKILLDMRSPSKRAQSLLITRLLDKRDMFIFRDYLGKYDSYRLYKEDEPDYDLGMDSVNITTIVSNDKSKLTTLAILVHEPHLIQTIKKMYPELIEILMAFIENDLLDDKKFSSDHTNMHFVIEAFARLDIERFLDKQTKFRILETINQNMEQLESESERDEFKRLFSHIGYVYMNCIVNSKRDRVSEFISFKTQNLIRDIWFDLFETSDQGQKVERKKGAKKGKMTPEFDFEKERLFKKYVNKGKPAYYKFYRHFYNEIIPLIGTNPKPEINHFLQLQKSYGILTLDFLNHRNITDYSNFEKIVATLESFINAGHSEIERKKFVSDFEKYLDELEENILKDLIPVLEIVRTFRNIEMSKLSQKCLELVSKIRKTIKPSLNTEFIKKGLDENLLELLSDEISQFNELILHPSSELSRFIRSSKSDLGTAWNESLDEYNRINKISERIPLRNLAKKDFQLNIHPFILNQIFLHILNNKHKYAEKARCNYSVVQQKNQKTVVLRFEQDRSFIKDFSGRRGLSEIRNMLNLYGGFYYLIEQKPNFIFEIVLPLN